MRLASIRTGWLGPIVTTVLTAVFLTGCTVLGVESTRTSTEEYQGDPTQAERIRLLQEEQLVIKKRLDALERKVK